MWRSFFWVNNGWVSQSPTRSESASAAVVVAAAAAADFVVRM